MKSFFVICPIGAENSDERVRSDRVYKYLIKPAVEQAVDGVKLEILRSDFITEPGRITRQIIEKLVAADVVIADLTNGNANVMYELGLRQGLLKPYVLLCEKNQKLPFDLADLRTVFYQLELEAVDKAKDELAGHITSALKGEVSLIDRELLSSGRGTGEVVDSQKSTDFELLEANGKIMGQLESMNEILLNIGQLVVNIHNKEEREFKRQKEVMEQQIGMQVFSQLLANPDQIEKTLPAIQAIMKFGEAVRQSGSSESKSGSD